MELDMQWTVSAPEVMNYHPLSLLARVITAQMNFDVGLMIGSVAAFLAFMNLRGPLDFFCHLKNL
jgi:hypothetical protein